jgi:hypothetical protein
MVLPKLRPGSFYDQLLAVFPQNYIQENSKNIIKALSWKQPYGTLMLWGKEETRVWATTVRCFVLICTSQVSYSQAEQLELSGKKQFDRIKIIKEKDLPRGKAIGIGRIADCRKMVEADEDKTFVKFNPKLYVHQYADVHPIEPIDWIGCRGFGRVVSMEEIKMINILPAS